MQQKVQVETLNRFKSDQSTATKQIMENGAPKNEATVKVKQAAAEAHQERLKLTEITQKKKEERKMAEAHLDNIATPASTTTTETITVHHHPKGESLKRSSQRSLSMDEYL